MSSTTDLPSPIQPHFPGFARPQQNWVKLPYYWTDITAKITSLAELKVVEYVLKHTWGYQEFGLKKKISIDEFMHGRKRKDGRTIDLGTGLSKQSVIDGLKKAVMHGFLEVEKDDSDQARKKRYYSLKMQETTDEDPESQLDNGPADDTSDRGGEAAHHRLDVGNGTTQKKGEVKHLDADVKNLDISSQTSRHRSWKELEKENLNNNKRSQHLVSQAVVDVLISEKIEPGTAQRLASLEHVTLEFVLKQIDQRDFLRGTAPERVKRPTAFLVRAIQRSFPEPDGYQPKAMREAAAAAHRQQAAERQRRHAQMEQQMQHKQTAHQHALNQKRQQEVDGLAQLEAEWGTGDREKQLWRQVLDELKVQLKSTIGYGVIEHSVLLAVEKGKAVIGVPNSWAKEYVTQRLAPSINEALAQHLGEQTVEVKFITPDLAFTSSLATGVATGMTAGPQPDRQLSFG